MRPFELFEKPAANDQTEKNNHNHQQSPEPLLPRFWVPQHPNPAQSTSNDPPDGHRGSLLLPLPPQRDAAEDAGLVGDDLYVLAGVEGDFFCVATADVEVVPVECGRGLSDGLFEELVPGLLAELVEASAAQVVLVGLAFPGVVAEFKAGAEPAVGEKGGAHAGAEGKREFDALAADGAIALYCSVVGDADGPLPALLKFGL